VILTLIAAMESPVVFRLEAPRPVKSVHLAGTFNNWTIGRTPMQLGADGKTWSVSIPLAFGVYQYKFVLDGSEWIVDPKGKSVDDGNGNTNSLILVRPADYDRPAVKGDGIVSRDALQHQSGLPNLNYDRGRLNLTLRARPDDAERVEVTVNGRSYPLAERGRDDLFAYYSASIPWNRKDDLKYSFRLMDGANRVEFGAPFEIRARDFVPFETPQWAEGAVVYQIFPDRFENGDRSNDPADVQPWDAKPTYFNRFGGDAKGIQNRIPYLKGLGVEAIYFNPIFRSPSNHRYDATSFREVDPQIGTNAQFAELTKALERNGIATLLDISYNHTATDFPQFMDLREKGADSRYKDWFFPKSFPIKVQDPPNYEAWFGFPSMPKVNLNNPEARKFMLDSVAFWHKELPGLKGIRLDVADQIQSDFWVDYRKVVKSQHPDHWIVGENWGNGLTWLKGDMWDSQMGYEFRDANLRFLAEGQTKPSQYLDRLFAIYGTYPPQVSRSLMNLLSSHDTPRFLTLAKDERKAMLAAAVQLTWPGTPSIYYGEEIAMEGERDPDNRRAMRWDTANDANSMLRHYRRLIELRRESKALRHGEPVRLMANDETGAIAFGRVHDGDTAITMLNVSPRARSISVPLTSDLARAGVYRNRLTDDRGPIAVRNNTISLTLAPMTAAVLLPAKASSRSTRADSSSRPTISHISTDLRRSIR